MIPNTLRCLYLHGFRSGPSSTKAQQALSWFASHDLAQNIHIPQLATDPKQAMDEMQFLYEQLIDEVGAKNCLVIGSSLGGYFASYLVEHYGGRAALINPAVRPYELLHDYLGENENLYNGEKFEVTESHLDGLKAMDTPVLQFPKRHLLLVQTHDETLDATQAVHKYRQSPSIIEYGGNHSYEDFPKRLPSILNFATQPY